MFFFVFSYGASQRRPCVRIGLTHAYLSHVKMTLANAKSVNRQTLENVVRNAASEFTRRTAIASLASLPLTLFGNSPLVTLPLPETLVQVETNCMHVLKQGAVKGDRTKVTENAQNADFRRKPQIFADSPLLLGIPAFGGRRKPQKTADFRRKPKIFAENRRKPQIGLRHLRCVSFSSALVLKQGKCQNVKMLKVLGALSGKLLKRVSSALNTLAVEHNPCLSVFCAKKECLRQGDC